MLNKIIYNNIILSINILVFLFFITILTFRNGYSYIPLTLIIISIIYLGIYRFKLKEKIKIHKDDKLIIFSFVSYFLSFFISMLIHNGSLKELENPSRALLCLPLLILFSHYPIHFRTILYGVPIGSAIAGIIALYKKYILGQERAFSDTMSIQSGNISLTLATMSLVISIYWGIKKNYKLMIISLLFSFLGLLASGLSGSRGGWVGLPLILGVILLFAYHHLSKKISIILTLLITASISSIIFLPQTKVLNRITIAKEEVLNYFHHDIKDSSLGARLDMWNSAILGIQEKPIYGWGRAGYMDLKKKQFDNDIIAYQTLLYKDSHNQYLDALVKRGSIGFLGLCCFMFLPFYIFYRNYKSPNILESKILSLLGITCILSICGYFLSQTFLGHNSGITFYLFIITILYSAHSKLEYPFSSK